MLAFLLAFAGTVSAHSKVDAQELRCLALTLFWEARTEGRAGMVAVAAVVFNRVRHAGFPDSVCGVVRQGGETPPCQFSYWCDGKSDVPRNPRQWALARQVARESLNRQPPDPTRGSLFFHAININVPWRVARERTVIIGRHAYYR